MDKEYLPKIFDAFSRENGDRKTKFGSSGLGLAITKRIVEMMNGFISVTSEKGVGTEFTVMVTLRNCENNEHVRAMESNREAMYVLVVDDDPIEVEHARMVLEEVGIRADAWNEWLGGCKKNPLHEKGGRKVHSNHSAYRQCF